MGKRRASIIDVADAAGVARTTASDALNGKGRVAPETRERVHAAAERLGYRPNPLARKLLGGRTGLIAVAISHTTDITAALVEKDYLRQAIVALTGEALERELGLVIGPPTHHLEMWAKIPMDGSIILSPVRGDPLLPQLRRDGVPMVVVGRDPDGIDTDPYVDNDHVAGTIAVFDHLVAQGAGRPALIAIDLDDAFTDDCLSGYQAWSTQRRIEPQILRIPPGSPEASLDRMIQEFLRGPDAPDAVHATVWEVGVRIAKLASNLNVRIPDDLLLAACGDAESQPVDIPLTQLNLFPGIAAREALDLLMTVIGSEVPPISRPIPTRLAVRASTNRHRAQPKPHRR